jgi:hypothetical protein
VIDGDGQSVVNLAGHDLRSFSRVVLKGDDKSHHQPAELLASSRIRRQPPAMPVVFEYELKVNRDIQSQAADARGGGRSPRRAEAVTLVCGGRRIHVFAKKRATFGRQRRTGERRVPAASCRAPTEHDEGSRAISRTHMALDLTDDGLVLVDEKSSEGGRRGLRSR